jgi:hypothetical protein
MEPRLFIVDDGPRSGGLNIYNFLMTLQPFRPQLAPF